jgi:hypothetical protein
MYWISGRGHPNRGGPPVVIAWRNNDIDWSCRWCQTTSLNCEQQRPYCLSTRWYVSMENHGGMILAGENSCFVCHSDLWQYYRQRHLVSIEEDLGGGNNGFCLQNISFRLVELLTCLKILRHGVDGFNLRPNQGVLRIFVAVKNQSCLPDMNTRTLGPMTSTLTITPPRRRRNNANKH